MRSLTRSSSPAETARNPNYQRMRERTLEKIRGTLQKIQSSNRSYDTLAELIKDVAIFSGVARSTIKPYRNAEAYHLVASFFGHLTVDPNKVPDEVADEFVLRLKLALARAENAELARSLKAAKTSSSQALTVASTSDQDLTELYQVFIQFLIRNHGSIQVNVKKGTIEDRFPERGFDRVLASGTPIKRFAEWLKLHPTFGNNKELFLDG